MQNTKQKKKIVKRKTAPPRSPSKLLLKLLRDEQTILKYCLKHKVRYFTVEAQIRRKGTLISNIDFIKSIAEITNTELELLTK